MKKLLFIISFLISVLANSQDTIYINNVPNVVKIRDFDSTFIYFEYPGSYKIRKAHKSVVNKYVLYDPISFMKNSPEYEYYTLNKNIDSVNYKIGYIRYNLSKHQSGATVGISFTTIGLLTAITTPYLIKVPTDYADYPEYADKVKTAVFVGSGIALIGTIISINSYKWIKRASIQPTFYGAQINYKF